MNHRHRCSVGFARHLYDGVKLLGERPDDARAKTPLGLLGAEIRLADTGVGDRELPVGTIHLVRDGDPALCRVLGKACFSALMTSSVTINPMLTA